MPESIKHVRPKRFPVLIRGRWWPLLIPFGVTQERAFVQVGERELRVCFGPLFDYRFPLEAVETVAPSRWPLWAGIGPRVDFRGTVAFVGAVAVALYVLNEGATQRHVEELVTAADRQHGQVALQRPAQEEKLVGVARLVGPLCARATAFPVEVWVNVHAAGQHQPGRLRGQLRPVHHQRLTTRLAERLVVVLGTLERGRPPVGQGDAGHHLS